MAKKITAEIEKKYVKNLGLLCPSCGSDNLDGGRFEGIDDGYVNQSVICLDCGEKWTDQYKLVGIVESQ